MYHVPAKIVFKGRDVMPTNKTELLLLVERYFARRFHQTVYLLNQLSSDLDRYNINSFSEENIDMPQAKSQEFTLGTITDIS